MSGPALQAAPDAAEPWDGTGPDPGEVPGPPGADPLDDMDAPDEGDRPTIRIAAGQLSRQVRELIHALGEGDDNLFSRAGELVRIIREPERREPYERDTRHGREIFTRPGTPRLRAAGPVLLEKADQVARWARFKPRRGKDAAPGEGEWIPSDPCGVTVKQVAARGDWPGIRPIKGILETPCLAPGGRLITAPGYDDETRFVLLPTCDVGNIRDIPTREHARAALRYLWIETVSDFPYRGMGEADNARDPDRVAQYTRALETPDAFVGIAMLLTMFSRLAIDGAVPGGLFEAAGQGSGKSLQIHVISMIATGRAAGVATFPAREGRPNEEELEKIIAGYALAAARLVAFDNIRGLLAGGTLERVLTAVDTIDLRVLGSNDQRTLPWWAIMLFSGNNMVMSDDVAQRLMISRLESPREDPRSRPDGSFRHPDLLAWIKAHRPRLVRAVLVVLRAYLAARAAGHEVPEAGTRGSFEAWSRIVPGAIMYAGGPNVLRAFPESGRGGDEEGEAHATLLRLWPASWQGQRATSILKLLFDEEHAIATGKAPPDGLDDARAAVRALTSTREGASPSAHAFGMKLWRLRGKIRDGKRLDAGEDKSTKVRTYTVVAL